VRSFKLVQSAIAHPEPWLLLTVSLVNNTCISSSIWKYLYY